LGIKDLKKELTEMRFSMEKMTNEIHETTIAIREALKLTSDTIKEMSETFSKTLENALRQMSELTIQMNIKDTILKNLGIDGMISDFFKKRK
jgi:methyl-accepting chemotaxis protein